MTQSHRRRSHYLTFNQNKHKQDEITNASSLPKKGTQERCQGYYIPWICGTCEVLSDCKPSSNKS